MLETLNGRLNLIEQDLWEGDYDKYKEINILKQRLNKIEDEIGK